MPCPHDVGSADGLEYLVMELLEGQTLAERLEKGPLPPEQVLRAGIEIAGALDRAHAGKLRAFSQVIAPLSATDRQELIRILSVITHRS